MTDTQFGVVCIMLVWCLILLLWILFVAWSIADDVRKIRNGADSDGAK